MSDSIQITLSIRLIRLLPAEAAHAIGLWAVKSGAWRPAIALDALCTLAWAIPASALLRWSERQIAREAQKHGS